MQWKSHARKSSWLQDGYLPAQLRHVYARHYTKGRQHDHDQQDDEQHAHHLCYWCRQGQESNQPPDQTEHNKVDNKIDELNHDLPFKKTAMK